MVPVSGPGWLARCLQPFDSERRAARPVRGGDEERVEWGRAVPFVAMHAACLLVPVVGTSATAVWTAVALYAARMFAVTAFFHRCFAHRAFVPHRALLCLGAVVGTASAQRGPLWWAAHHRRHHAHTDRDGDAHSPVHHGFLWSHMGWFLNRRNFRTDHDRVRDLHAFRELVWLDRYDLVVPVALLVTLGAVGWLLAAVRPDLHTDGWQLMVWGFCVSTTVLFHATSAVNSLGHHLGRRPWPTRDRSGNSFWLALLTFGEGWHNNHHWCPGAVRQGFRWWQVDLSWYALALLARCGLVAPLRPLPPRARRAA